MGWAGRVRQANRANRARSRGTLGGVLAGRRHPRLSGFTYAPRLERTEREEGSNKETMVEVVSRYSKLPAPLLLGSSKSLSCPAVHSAPRVHALHRRLSQEIRDQLLADYQAGISAKQLAGRYQLSRSSIRVLLRESGLPQRYQAMTETETNQAVELYGAGSTIAEVAAVLGRPCSTIQTALARRGVARRSRHDYS